MPQRSSDPAARSASPACSTSARSFARWSPVPSAMRRIVSLTHSGRSGGSSVTVSVTATHIAPKPAPSCSLMCENAARLGRKAALEDEVAGISKSETLNRLSEKTGLTKKQVGTVLDELAALSYKEARNGFTFPGVGKLVIVDRKARLGRNPATGETIQIPAKRVLKFRIAKQAKDSTLAKRGK